MANFLRPMVKRGIQEFLEAEMAQAVGAEKGERAEGRMSYRSGYYPRSLVTRVESSSSEFLRIARGNFRPRSSSATNAVKRRSWRR